MCRGPLRRELRVDEVVLRFAEAELAEAGRLAALPPHRLASGPGLVAAASGEVQIMFPAAGSIGKFKKYTGVPFYPAMTIYDFFIKRALDQLYYDLYWVLPAELQELLAGVKARRATPQSG